MIFETTSANDTYKGIARAHEETGKVVAPGVLTGGQTPCECEGKFQIVISANYYSFSSISSFILWMKASANGMYSSVISLSQYTKSS